MAKAGYFNQRPSHVAHGSMPRTGPKTSRSNRLQLNRIKPYSSSKELRWRKRRNARYALALVVKLIRRRLARRLSTGTYTTKNTNAGRQAKRSARIRPSALSLVGKLIKRRFQCCSLLTRGVNLVRQLSSCSLASLNERTLVPFWSVAEKDKLPSIDNGIQGSLSSVNSDTCGNRSSDDKRENRQLARLDSCQSAVKLNTPMVDCNLNAIKEDLEGGSHRGPSRSVAVSRRRKAVGRQPLVARSIGRPKLIQHGRPRNKVFPLFAHASKMSKRLRLLRKRHKRLRSRKEQKNTLVSLRNDDRQMEQRKMQERKNGSLRSSPQPQNLSFQEDRKLSGTEVDSKENATCSHKVSGQGEQKEDSPPCKEGGTKKRERKQKRGLVNLFAAGPSAETAWECKDARSKLRRKGLKSNRAINEGVSQSSLVSSYPCRRKGSADSVEWPALPISGRQKCLTKETAKEIVLNKQCGSVIRMTRRRWADIVASRTKGENAAQEIISKPATPQRTWASVAAHSLNHHAGTSANNPETENSCKQNATIEVSPSPKSKSSSSASLNNSRLKRKSGSRLAYTDRLWADTIKGKGKPSSHKFFRRLLVESGDKSKKRIRIRSRRNRTKQRDDQGRPAAIASDELVPEQSALSGKKENTPEQPIPANERSAGQGWCIDNMSIVYTQPVGPVISLNDPQSIIVNCIRGVNKCNNRTVTPSKTRAALNRVRTRSTTLGQKEQGVSESGMELCDRLSSISFQSSSGSDDIQAGHGSKVKRRGSLTPRQKTLKTKNLTASPHGQKDGSKPCSEEKEPYKQKKISSRYRALLRGESGRLDAKTLTEITTRSKRTDSLRQDKVVTRAMQKQQRHQRQESQHSTQRPPTVSTERSRNVTLYGEGCSWQSVRDDPEMTGTPKNNSGSNDLLNHLEWNAVPYRPTMAARCADLKTPVHARSAPELAKRQSNICVDLHLSNADSLDIGWWHAYLVQLTDPRVASENPPSPQGVAAATSNR